MRVAFMDQALLLQFTWKAFAMLLVIVDPFAVVPVFVFLTHKESKDYRLAMARKASMIGLAILLVFAVMGDRLLDMLEISEPAFRIAGGLLLLMVAIDMVVAKQTGARAPTAEESEEAAHKNDISVFPLAVPLIAGPGGMTSVTVLMREAEKHGVMYQWSIIACIVTVIMLTYYSLKYSTYLLKLLGITGMNVLTRVFGIILAALAIQGVINGVLGVVAIAKS